jgi:hypothetical protein
LRKIYIKKSNGIRPKGRPREKKETTITSICTYNVGDHFCPELMNDGPPP